MESENLNNLIHDRCIADIEYLTAKENREKTENDLLLKINWKQVNDERLKENLPKISNESQRKAFIQNKIYDLKHKENCLYLKVRQLEMIYENREDLNYIRD